MGRPTVYLYALYEKEPADSVLGAGHCQLRLPRPRKTIPFHGIMAALDVRLAVLEYTQTRGRTFYPPHRRRLKSMCYRTVECPSTNVGDGTWYVGSELSVGREALLRGGHAPVLGATRVRGCRC